MPPPDEPNATGGGFFSSPQDNVAGMGPRASVSSSADIQIPKVSLLHKAIKGLRTEISELQKVMAAFAQSGVAKKLATDYAAIAKSGKEAAQAVAAENKSVSGRNQAGGFGGSLPNAWQTRDRKDPASTVKMLTESSSAGSAGGSGGGGAGNLPPPSAPRAFGFGKGTSPSNADVTAAQTMGTGVANNPFLKDVTGSNGIMGLLQAPLAAITGQEQLWGSLAGGSMQYTYNRINGPSGNMNAMLQLAQALAPNATLMGAATGKGISIQKVIQGLAQRMPVMGTQQDMLSTILSGQSVGALMAGTPSRNGFFESVRQAQVLMPGQAPGTISGNIAGYIGNVKAQQMGAMMGEGAFTMVGTGGRYKTLAEWAHGITEFLKQHRPGADQGKSFTAADLIAQNFPGSNINAWFQFMGVPQSMVDYWWQYVLTSKSGVSADKVTSDTLQAGVTKARGMNLGYEQLRTATQSTRRDYLMGNQMYAMYGANASANRRFNVAMQGTDQALSKALQGTNLGRMIALLPTPIMELLMPLLTQLLSSPAGAAASAVGGVLGNIMGDPGDHMPYGGMGDVGWGEAGGTTTAHLSPDLAKRVQTMMAANPALKISSGYRDTGTQNRLRRGGARAVGHPSRSAHTRGWAVDIGPASQMGWLMGNANKFGLATAANYGEPWHIQRAGTPMVGDPMPYGDIGPIPTPDISDPMSLIPGASAIEAGGNAIGSVFSAVGLPNPFDALGDMAKSVAEGVMSALKNFLYNLMKDLQTPFQKALDNLIGGGTFSDMIGKATDMFSRLVTAPIMGAANLGGKASGGPSDLMNLINQPAVMNVTVDMGTGFTAKTPSTTPIFGDPMPIGDPMPYGGPISMMPWNGPRPSGGDMGSMVSLGSAAGASQASVVIHIHAPITIKGDMKSGADARRMAGVLLDHMEEQATQRDWLKQ